MRNYEVDLNGHVNHAVYHQYGEHARSEHMRAAGFTLQVQRERQIGMVVLESRIRYLRELLLGDEVEITSEVAFGSGKSFRIEHEFNRSDGVCASEISCVMGLLDMTTRRLVADPGGTLASFSGRPELLAAVPG